MAKSRQQLRREMRKGNTDKKSNSTWLWVVIAVLLVAALIFVGLKAVDTQSSNPEETPKTESSEAEKTENSNEEVTYDKEPQVEGEHDKVKFVMEDSTEFIVELYPEYAPQTVENFKKLVSDGFYDGLTFHRVVEDFMAQGGDPNGDGSGGSETAITGEFVSNGFAQNTLSHQRGVISMARTNDPNSASSGFFICYNDASFLDGNYAAFGKVIEGMENVDKFLEVERTENQLGEIATPTTPIVIKSATVME